MPLEAARLGIDAATLLYSRSVHEAVITADCAWARELVLSDETIDAAPESDIDQLVSHNDLWREHCTRDD